MVEISFWHPDGKTHTIYTSDDIDTVKSRIENVSDGSMKYAIFSNQTGKGRVYIPSFVLRECIVTVAPVLGFTTDSVVL